MKYPLLKKIKYISEFLIVKVVDLFFHILPRSVAFWIGECIGLIVSVVIPKRRKLILNNLEHALPGQNGKKKIASKVWRNLGRTAVEFLRIPEINRSNYKKYFEFENDDVVEKAMSQGCGAIGIAFHFANWEMAGLGHQLRFGNMVAIARPMKNPYVESWVQGKRKNGGVEVILHRKAVRESLRVLKQKKCISILVDQNLYQGGTFVTFFGRPAATTTLPALLHVRTGAPVFIGYGVRKGSKFLVRYEAVEFPEGEKEEERVQVYTQTISDQVEKIIRKNPENWFWIHNRWKRQPDHVPTH